jgi:hypothetical protein
MSLTRADQERLDESVQIRGFPATITIRPARPGAVFPETRRRRSVVPAWRLAAERRRQQLDLYAAQIGRDDRL